MAWQRAIVEIEGKRYYDDTRLQEYRNIKNFMDTIRYDELGNQKVKLLQGRIDLQGKLLKRLPHYENGKQGEDYDDKCV